MKHGKLFILVFIFLFLAAMSLPVYAGSGTAEMGTPIIDGIIDDIWAKTETYSVGFLKGGTADDVKSEFKMMWDDKYLYFIAIVTDPDIAYSASDTYKKDGVQLYFDFTNQFASSYGEINGGEYTLYLRDSKNELPTLSDVTSDASHDEIINDILYEYKLTDKGYIIEARFNPKLNYNGFKLAEGTEFAFDVQVNDQKSDSDERAAAYGWTDDKDEAWQTPSVLGSVKLVKTAETAAAETAAAEIAIEETSGAAAPVTAAATADISVYIYLLTAISLAGSTVLLKKRK